MMGRPSKPPLIKDVNFFKSNLVEMKFPLLGICSPWALGRISFSSRRWRGWVPAAAPARLLPSALSASSVHWSLGYIPRRTTVLIGISPPPLPPVVAGTCFPSGSCLCRRVFRQLWALRIPQVVVEEVDLLLHLIHLLCVLGHNVLSHKVWPLEFLARQGAQPLVLSQLLS